MTTGERRNTPHRDGHSESVPRILLVRLSAIGDIVFASPLIAAFRRAHP